MAALFLFVLWNGERSKIRNDNSTCNFFNRPPKLKQFCQVAQHSWAYIRAFRSPLDRRNRAQMPVLLLFESFVFFVTILRLSPSLTCKFVPFTPSRIGNTWLSTVCSLEMIPRRMNPTMEACQSTSQMTMAWSGRTTKTIKGPPNRGRTISPPSGASCATSI